MSTLVCLRKKCCVKSAFSTYFYPSTHADGVRNAPVDDLLSSCCPWTSTGDNIIRFIQTDGRTNILLGKLVHPNVEVEMSVPPNLYKLQSEIKRWSNNSPQAHSKLRCFFFISLSIFPVMLTFLRFLRLTVQILWQLICSKITDFLICTSYFQYVYHF